MEHTHTHTHKRTRVLEKIAVFTVRRLCIAMFVLFCIHIFTPTRFDFTSDVVCLLDGGRVASADLCIAPVPKSHHVSRIDSRLSPPCVYGLRLMPSWQSSRTLCFNSGASPAGETGALNMTYPSCPPYDWKLIEPVCVCLCCALLCECAFLHFHTHTHTHTYIPGTNFNFILPLRFRRAKTSHAIAQRGAVNTAGEMGLGEHTTLPELPENIQIVFIFH